MQSSMRHEIWYGRWCRVWRATLRRRDGESYSLTFPASSTRIWSQSAIVWSLCATVRTVHFAKAVLTVACKHARSQTWRDAIPCELSCWHKNWEMQACKTVCNCNHWASRQHALPPDQRRNVRAAYLNQLVCLIVNGWSCLHEDEPLISQTPR